jgi:uncharacterized protein (TIGR02246 family)
MRSSKKFFGEWKRTRQASWFAAGAGRIAAVVAWVALAAMLAAPALVAGISAAQNNKKNDNKQTDTTSLLPAGSMPDAQAIDLVVGQMLGAWQVGEVEMMRKYYADDVVVISGAWEQPLIGWENYARAYQSQYARMNGCRLERTNTYAKVLGEDAWVTYQWQFSGQVDGAPSSAVGHTTLVLQKRAGTWVIVLNHTSQVAERAQPVTAPPTSPRPVGNAAPFGGQR